MCECVTCQCISKQIGEQKNKLEFVNFGQVERTFVTGLIELAASWDELGNETRARCAKELRQYIESHT